jgi:hypothetical protein
MAAQLVDYDQLYPGRFLKSGELLGKKPTVTITAVEHEELADDKGPEGATKTKVVISFKETPKKLVTCKTNGICLKAMFGRKVTDWIGKRVQLQAEVWNGKDCIRFHGSPDIERDMDVEIALPRRRPFKKTMKAAAPPQRNARPQAPAPSPSVADLGKCAALVASLEKVADEDVDRWWQDNVNAIDALSQADLQTLQAVANRKAGT